MKDKDIWNYCKQNNLSVITKDSDFSNRILFNEPPPKVIHIKTGNQSMQTFHEIVTACWDDVLLMSETHKLVNVYPNKIEGIK